MTIRPQTIILTTIALVLIAIVAIPSWRLSVRNYILPDSRTLIAKIDGNVSKDGPNIIVLKIKSRDQYYLEIYKANQNLELMQRIALEEPLDGSFYFRGQYTDLAMSDLDNDGYYEILVPMYDKNSTPRLLIYKYNPSLQSFEKLTGE